jgi:hypothetical protein
MQLTSCVRAFVPSCLLALLPTCLLLAGCLERTETISVRADGTVAMSLSFETGSFDELYLGDAVPSVDRGWLVQDWQDLDEEGKEVFHLTAEQTFDGDEPLPEDYAALKHPYREQVLRFPTSVTFETRRDGTYVHFRRVYPPRAWAYLEVPSQPLRQHIDKVVQGGELTDLDPAAQRVVLETLARLELLKITSFARAAFNDVTPDAPQDAWLAVNAALRPLARSIDVEAIVELLLREDDDPRAKADLEARVQAFRDQALETATDALRAGGWYSASRTNQFARQFDQHREFHAITEDLGDDNLTVTVTMPGVVVGHNGDAIKGAAVTWKLNGQMMRDREVELMVSSRLD